MNVLKTKDISIGYLHQSKPKVLMEQISVSADEGEMVALIGSNGSGKSTLLRSLCRLQPVFKGEICYNSQSINSYHRTELALLLGFVPTEQVNIPNLSVYQLVSLGRYPHTNIMGNLTSDDKQIIENSIEMVGLQHLSHKLITEISDGERQRVLIARALAQDTSIIILDEPTAFLDLPHKFEIVHLLKKLAHEQNKIIIFSTHDLNIALSEADKIWLMFNNSIVEGAPEDLILKHYFNKFFDGKLLFDVSGNTYKTEKFYTDYVKLMGGDVFQQLCVIKALERIGIGVDENAQIIIELRNNKTELEMILQNGNERICCLRISEVVNKLKVMF